MEHNNIILIKNVSKTNNIDTEFMNEYAKLIAYSLKDNNNTVIPVYDGIRITIIDKDNKIIYDC